MAAIFAADASLGTNNTCLGRDVSCSMAKARRAGPDYLTMSLFAPGMSALHRAGLGGLACTLAAMKRSFKAGLLREDKLPAPLDDDNLPWEVDEHTVTLRFGKPERAREYLEKLFAFAFDIRTDGLISLPGQHECEPSAVILAYLQSGLTLTFLQHSQSRKLAKEPYAVTFQPRNAGSPARSIPYRKCLGFKNQHGWKELVRRNGCLREATRKVDGPICPGAMARHVAYRVITALEDPPNRLLALYFAIVGCLALPVSGRVAILLVPEFDSLIDFVKDRPATTPIAAEHCQIANAADAALQAQVRLRAKHDRNHSFIPGYCAVTFRANPWTIPQKSRVAIMHVPRGENRVLDRFARALDCLPVRIASPTTKSKPRGKKHLAERQEFFRSGSIIRPLVAVNLASRLPWYSGFSNLMAKRNPATNRPYRVQLPYERKGLRAMIADDIMWDTQGEKTIIKAVHEAMRCRHRQIAEENKSSTWKKGRFSREYHKWRLAFSSAKTVHQFGKVICDFFSRAGGNAVLKQSWRDILPMLRATTWQHTRDLALLGLCSYPRRGEPEGAESAYPLNLSENAQ